MFLGVQNLLSESFTAEARFWFRHTNALSVLFFSGATWSGSPGRLAILFNSQFR